MIEYAICNQADQEIFHQQCLALEKNIPGIRKEELLEDVDGSLIQSYLLGQSRIVVYNSYYTNEVYIKSDIDLRQFFNNP